MNNEIKVIAAPLPFSNKQTTHGAAPGSSIKDIIDNVVPDRIKSLGIGASVFINGEEVPQQYWSRVKPKMGTLVNINIVPMDSDKKNPLATILSIAVMIAAPYASAAILGGGIIASSAAGAALISSGLTAAIGAVGRLAVSALAPPPRPSNSGVNVGGNPASSPTQFIEGASNSIIPYGVVPICLGTNRMVPLQAARPYSETINNDQYVRQLFTYGWGNEIILDDLKIGETPIDEFEDFDIEHLINGDLNTGSALYSNDVFQENLSVTLNQVDGFTTRTTQPDIDEAQVDITFPAGLAEFNNEGKRISRRVQLELVYAASGVSPQDWTPAVSTYKATSGATRGVSGVRFHADTNVDTQVRKDICVIDIYSGKIYIVAGYRFGRIAATPKNTRRLSTITISTTRLNASGLLTTDISITDDRQSADFGTTFQDSSSFVPTKASATSITISSGALLVNDLDILGSQTEALRKSVNFKFPTNGQYDIRIRRITADTVSDQVIDDAALTSIKSIKYQNPVKLEKQNGSAILIKATDQLNGTLNQFNLLVSSVIPDYDPQLNDWPDRITSNPASIYRWVLQGPANSKPLEDSQIIIEDIEAWHQTCVAQGYSYNRVIDYETSVEEILKDIASAGAATPAVVDGKRTVAVDEIKDEIVQIVTPRNSWGYKADIIYPETPHAFRVTFRNADKGYSQDDIIVYDDGYDETNATIFEVLELQSCTNSGLAFKTARRHLASIKLRPETHTFMQDVENIVYLRGDRIKFGHDIPIIGIGDGRIKTITTSGGSPNLVTGFTIDDTVTIPSAATFYTRIRLDDGTQLYKELITTLGETSSFTFATPFEVVDTPAVGDLCYFVEAGGEVDLLITRIEPQDDLTARITAINYAPEIQEAENTEIPVFDSKITTPLEFIRPSAPVLLQSQSNEDVMLVNSDGSFLPRAIFTLDNLNDGRIETFVKIRVSGTTQFGNANILEISPNIVVLTGLEDGVRYDIHIRYSRIGASTFSPALELNSYLFIGASGVPNDVTGFKINVVDNVALLKWDKNTDIDISHYIIKYSNVFTGAAYGTSQTLEDEILNNRASVPFLGGTYFIKAIDLSGNESATAATIITYDPGTITNAVEVLTEDPSFTGTLDNIFVQGASIVLADTSLTDGYYYFASNIDLTAVFPAFVSAEIVAGGTFVNNFYDFTDVFAESDVLGGVDSNIFDINDVFAESDIFGIGEEGWSVELEYRTTQTDPAGSPVIWTDWAALEAGTLEFWDMEFRIKLTSTAQNISPQVTSLAVTVDMPDRIERGDDLTVPIAGASIVFNPDFKASPAIAITIQDAASDDKIEFVSKTANGFTFKVYNATLASYVERTYDYIASGYGRLNT